MKSVRNERVFNDISSLINTPQKTDLSWSEKIKSIVDITAQSNEWEYTYRRFNKRYFSQGIYTPGRSFKDKEAITVIVDVSGSMVMKPGDIESAFGIIEGLLRKFKIYLLCIDETLFVPEKKDNIFIKSDIQSRNLTNTEKGTGDILKPEAAVQHTLHLFSTATWIIIQSFLL